MGTLLNQPPRKSYSMNDNSMHDFLLDIKKIAIEMDVSFEIALKIVEIYELRRKNDLNYSDFNIKDEQLSGFGALLQALINVIDEKK